MPSEGNLILVSYEYFHVDGDMGREVIDDNTDNVDEVYEVKLTGELRAGLMVNENIDTNDSDNLDLDVSLIENDERILVNTTLLLDSTVEKILIKVDDEAQET